MAKNNTLKSNDSIQNDLVSNEEEESFSYAMQVVMSSVVPMALQTTMELGVFDVIAKAGEGSKLSAIDIAHRLPMIKNPGAPKMLDRVLGLLATHSLLHCSEGEEEEQGVGFSTCGCRVRLYSLAPASKFFAGDAENAMSLGPLVDLVQHKTYLESWFHLKDAITGGGSTAFERGHEGISKFEYLGLDSELNQIFNTASIHHTYLVMKKVLESYRGFENLNSLVDVGGGLGVTLSLITSKYPHVKAINFDLPHVIKHAPSYPGVQHVAGDMFETIPKGDAIFMKWILHDWSDEKCLKLLKNCYDSIPEDGKVISMESVISAMPETSSSAKCNFQSDVFMMAQGAAGGRVRNNQEFMHLAKSAGFRGVQYQCFVRNFWVMEFFK